MIQKWQRGVLLLCALLSFAPAVYASGDTFGGFYAGASVGGSINVTNAQSTYDYTNLFAGGADASDRARTQPFSVTDRSDIVTGLNLDYFRPITGRFFLGAGGSIFFESDKEMHSGTFLFSNPGGRADFPKNYEIFTTLDPKAHLAIGIKPGMQVTKKMLFYSSVSYHFLKAGIKSGTGVDTSNLLRPKSVIKETSDRKTFHGIGLGGGIKYKLFKGICFDFLAEWIWFGRKTVTGPGFYKSDDEITLTQNIHVTPSWINLMAGLSYEF